MGNSQIHARRNEICKPTSNYAYLIGMFLRLPVRHMNASNLWHPVLSYIPTADRQLV